MSLITGNIKSLLNIKIKARHDNYTDQFNRIFMVKMAMVASMLLGLNWLKDEITCIIPGTTGMDGAGKAFVHEACWIQGFYIYKQLEHAPGIRTYYGIPKVLHENGMMKKTGHLCIVSKSNPDCIPMEKTFYLQYQWFPFYTAILGVLYYMPYVLFRFVNTDLISLKGNIKGVNVDPDELVKNYFNYQINPPIKMRMRLIGNIFVKLCYVLSNIVVFITTDCVINGDFKGYGSKFVKWGQQGNEKSYDYTSRLTRFRAGDTLLPTFGICEVLELAKDVKHHLYNEHRFVCEISQNVLYQYVLIVLWFLFILGIAISCIGLIMQLASHLVITCFLTQGSQARKVYEVLTLRECEYLEFMRRKDLAIYGKVIRKLKEERLDKYGNDNGYAPSVPQSHPFEASQKLLEETVARL